MASLEQIDDLYRFARELPAAERDALSVDEIYDRWRQDQVLEEDVRAVQEALDDFDRGEQGRPVEGFLSEFRRKRRELGDSMETAE